ncbi:hypothetical protein PBY51_010859 [Eleginops maclovinus]|uniref:Uncharacterized protein n=1 Tax=Eleginops maclovinus TaxID=56733 RepID=A0AAN7XCG5_ELEMC|nr:hypothetical protein PBY51_010859 [Eleginops maclovinus]
MKLRSEVYKGLPAWLEECVPSGFSKILQPLTSTLKRWLPPLQVQIAISIQIQVPFPSKLTQASLPLSFPFPPTPFQEPIS